MVNDTLDAILSREPSGAAAGACGGLREEKDSDSFFKGRQEGRGYPLIRIPTKKGKGI
jgi:hypothetical protein